MTASTASTASLASPSESDSVRLASMDESSLVEFSLYQDRSRLARWPDLEKAAPQALSAMSQLRTMT